MLGTAQRCTVETIPPYTLNKLCVASGCIKRRNVCSHFAAFSWHTAYLATVRLRCTSRAGIPISCCTPTQNCCNSQNTQLPDVQQIF